jgi:hypothetical protein
MGLTFRDLRRANPTAMVLDGVDVRTAPGGSATRTRG